MNKLLMVFAVVGLALGFGTRAARADGADTFTKKCASCHGKDGKGQTKMGEKLKIKDLTKDDFNEAKALENVNNGVKDKDTGKERMPAFKDKLSADEVSQVVKYALSLKGK